MKYIIISLVYSQEIFADVHDLYIEECKSASQQIEKLASEMGAEVYIRESANDRAISSAFATVECNFDMPKECKEKLVEYIKPFFVDGNVLCCTLQEYNSLGAVRFLKTDGELMIID